MRLCYENIRVRMGKKEILKGVSLTAREGQVTGIIGPNGCGKSTLVRTTFGLVPLSGGTVWIDGKNAAGLSARTVASLAGYVRQEISCAFDFSVLEVVSMALYARRERGGSAEAIAAQALEDLGIRYLEQRKLFSLSGGERKLVYVARAVAQGTDLLILDEPTNHLDICRQIFLLNYLKTCGKTVLIVLHDLRLAAHYCDQLYLLSEGSVVSSGTPQEAMSPRLIREVFGTGGRVVPAEAGGLDFGLDFS